MVTIATLTVISSVSGKAGSEFGGGVYLWRPIFSMRGRMKGGCIDGEEDKLEKENTEGQEQGQDLKHVVIHKTMTSRHFKTPSL